MRLLTFLALTRVIEPGGCAGGPSPVDTSRSSGLTHRLALRTSGAIRAELDEVGDGIPASSSPRSPGPGFSGQYLLNDGPFGRVELEVDAVAEGATDADLPARLRLFAGPHHYASARCRARVERQTLETPSGGTAMPTGRSYRVEGSVACAQPLQDPRADGEGLVLERFEFALSVVWDFPRR